MTTGTILGVQPPGEWKDRRVKTELGQLGTALLHADVRNAAQVCHTGAGGTRWLNYEWRRCAEGRRIIGEIDRALVEAYGLQPDPLLKQIERMRTGSAHTLTTAG